MTNRETIIEAVKTYCRAEIEKDRASWMGLFADDIVHEDPAGLVTRRGLVELGNLWEMIVKGDVELRLIEDVIVCGNEAMGIMASESGPRGARRNIQPIVDHFVFNEAGKITRLRAFYKYA